MSGGVFFFFLSYQLRHRDREEVFQLQIRKGLARARGNRIDSKSEFIIVFSIRKVWPVQPLSLSRLFPALFFSLALHSPSFLGSLTMTRFFWVEFLANSLVRINCTSDVFFSVSLLFSYSRRSIFAQSTLDFCTVDARFSHSRRSIFAQSTLDFRTVDARFSHSRRSIFALVSKCAKIEADAYFA